MKYLQRKSRGAAAILVTMLILTFITTVSLVVARLMVQEIRISQDIEKSFRAREVAVTGLELGGWKLKQGNSLVGGVPGTLPEGGDYTVKLEGRKLVSTGRYAESERQLLVDLGNIPIVYVAAGAGHSLALDQSGNVWAWGRNGFGQLGDDSITNRNIPGKVLAGNQVGNTYLSNIKAIAAGNGLSLALENNGKVWAWGNDQQGQLGNSTVSSGWSKTPVGVEAGEQGVGFLSNIKEISSAGDASGGYHVLALDNSGNVWSWGGNSSGQLGNNSIFNGLTPVKVKDQSGLGFLSNVSDVVAGGKHSLALDASGDIMWAWGDNISGQLGNGGVGNFSMVPVKVQTGTQGDPSGFLANITDIGSGAKHSLAIDDLKHIWSWGLNSDGQLGDDNGGVNKTTPVQVVDALGVPFSNVVAVAGGGYHSLAIDENKKLWSWGSNLNGQLGDNSAVPERDTPGQVLGENGAGLLSDVTNVAGGNAHSLAQDSNFFLWSWGDNAWGQLGNGNINDQDTPVKVDVF